MSTAVQHYYANALRYIYLACILILFYMPSASTFISIVAVLALLQPHSNRYLKAAIFSAVGLSTILLLLIATIHLPHHIIPWHYTKRGYTRWLTYGCILLLGILFAAPRWRKLIIPTLYLGLVIAILNNFIYHCFGHLTLNSVLWQKIIIKPNLQHLQESATLFVIGAALSLHYALNYLRSKPIAISFLIIMCIAIIDLMFNGERVAYIALPIVITYVAYINGNWQKALLAITLCLAALAIGFTTIPSMRSRINIAVHALTNKDTHTSTAIRAHGIQYGIQSFKQKLMWGYGPGAFSDAKNYIFYQVEHQTLPMNVETAYLVIALQFGSIGLILFLIMIGGYWQQSENPELRYILLSIIIGGLTFPIFFTNIGISLLSCVAAASLNQPSEKSCSNQN